MAAFKMEGVAVVVVMAVLSILMYNNLIPSISIIYEGVCKNIPLVYL